jgi:DNA-binding CsgD family transcriptional regulator
MQMIAPRVKCTFLDSDLLKKYMTQVELLGNVIASAGFGLVLVRSNRQIVCANDAAEKLIRASSELRCEHGCICAPNFKTARKLQSLISAASRPIGELVPRRSIILRNEDGLASLVVHVVPFSPPSTVLMPDNERPVAGLFIVDCQRGTADRVDAFADLFQLTSAETRVLAQMILGEGLTIAARRLNIARSTARSHLDHILQKTGTHRQAELVRVFFETTIPWNGTVTLPNRARNKTPTTSGSCRSDAFTSRLQDRYPASSIQDRSSSQTTRDCSASDAFI